ncbi:MAG: response regulator [Spirochaetes bacterium]|nr:response regulator [Spirochaetota bacterium]
MECVECKGKSILVVDDEPAIRESIAEYLEYIGAKPAMAGNGVRAVEMLSQQIYDALILDLNMPELNGIGVIEKIVPRCPEMPIIVLSGVGIVDKAVEAIRKGAWDFLSKPIESLSVLNLTLNRALERSRLLKENRIYREHLEDEVKKKTEQVLEMSRSLIMTQKEIILRLGDVVETRSHETGNHVLRVSEYAYLLGKLAGIGDMADDIKIASPMHDVGKIGISDIILNKPGPLTDDEFRIIQGHSAIGYNIFSKSELPVLQLAADIALNHHERWNGEGYPNRKAGEAIPLSARITSIVDVFDAITHERVYKEAWGIEETLLFMRESAGKQFDPQLIDVFLKNKDSFLDIHERLS